jgi:hypothetical protein
MYVLCVCVYIYIYNIYNISFKHNRQHNNIKCHLKYYNQLKHELYTFTQTVRQFVWYDVFKYGDSEEYSLLGCHTAYWNRKLTEFQEAIDIFLPDCLELQLKHSVLLDSMRFYLCITIISQLLLFYCYIIKQIGCCLSKL